MAGETLKVVAGNAAGSSLGVEQELVIGRSASGAGSLGGDGEISKVHARVYRDGTGRLAVEDLGSTAGTYVNGSRITAATVLHPGDQVRVGQTTMTVESGAAGADVPSPPAPVTPPTEQLPRPPGHTSGGSKAPLIALAAAVLIALIVGGLAIGGVFSSDDKKQTASTTPAATPPTAALPTPPNTPSSGAAYPPGFVAKLIASCTRGGKLTPGQCKCWFTKLGSAYTYPQLVQVIKTAQAGSIPPKAVGLLRTCLRQ